MNDSLQVLGSGSGKQTASIKRVATVDYVLRPASNRPIAANRAAAAALRRLSELRRLSKRLDAAYAGAVVLQLLVESPWLAGFTLSFMAEAAYDDDGSYYRSVSVSAEDIDTVEGATFPEDAFTECKFAEEEAVAWVESEVENEASALYCAFRNADDYEDLSLKVCRKAVADLLDHLSTNGTASGMAAFGALWPQSENSTRPDL